MCINFPVAEITYKYDKSKYLVDEKLGEKEKERLYGHIHAKKFLAGGQLFIICCFKTN